MDMTAPPARRETPAPRRPIPRMIGFGTIAVAALFVLPMGILSTTGGPSPPATLLPARTHGHVGDGVAQLALARASLSATGFSPDLTIHPSAGMGAPAGRSQAQMTWDAADGYVLLFGGLVGNYWPFSPYDRPNDTWVYADGRWTELFPNPSPPITYAGGMAYDPAVGGVILYGGTSGIGAYNTTWEYRAGSWTLLSPPSSPPAMQGEGLVYDPNLGGVVLFGGYAGGWGGVSGSYVYDATWLFANGTWTNLSASVGAPPARVDAGLAYDAALGATVLFDGYPGGPWGTPLNDTWVLANGSWTNVTGGAAPPRTAAMGFAYDSTTRKILEFSGTNTTWEFSAAGWSPKRPAVQPPPRWGGTLSDDPADGGAVLFGGLLVSTGNDSRGTWTYARGNWSFEPVNLSIGPTAEPSLAYDAADGVVVAFVDTNPSNATGRSETWLFSAGNWSRATPTTQPSPRVLAAMAYDPSTASVLLYGGYNYTNGSDTTYGDTWSFSAGNWTRLTGNASMPTLGGATMSYDPGILAMLLFGGDEGSTYVANNPNTTWNHTWSYRNGTWTLLNTPVQPPRVASEPAMAYDPVDGYELLADPSPCGNGNGTCLTTWAFRNGQWVNITNPSRPAPPALSGAAMAWDGADQRIVLFGGGCVQSGGCGGVPEGQETNATWTFVHGNWTLLSTGSGAPGARAGAGIAYDAADGYLVLLGGSNSLSDFLLPTVHVDAWSFAGGNWSLLDPTLHPSYPSTDAGLPVRVALRTSIPGARPYVLSPLDQECAALGGGTATCTESAPGDYHLAFGVLEPGDPNSVRVATDLGVAPAPQLISFATTHPVISAGDETEFMTTVSGGTAPFTFTYSGLPAGCLSANGAVLDCTPSAQGTFTIHVSASDRFQEFGGRSIVLEVVGGGAPPWHAPRGTGPTMAHTGPLGGELGIWETMGLALAALVVAGTSGALVLRRWQDRRVGERILRALAPDEPPDFVK